MWFLTVRIGARPIIEGNGAVPAAPTGLVATHGLNQVDLSWNTVPGAISYNVKRSMSSGGEATIANVSIGQQQLARFKSIH